MMNNETRGLSAAAAANSALKYGTNTITRRKRKSFLKQYLASFGDPIIRILLVALAVNLLLLFRDANWYESAGIAVAVLLATLISTLSEYGSESAFEKLQEEAAGIRCRAMRDGIITELLIDDIVVGDIILLSAGEKIPADGHLIQGELAVDQSTLNGETVEANKRVAATRGDLQDFLEPDGLFRGSVVAFGEGIMRVMRVGDATVYGRLAIEVQEDTIESPLKARLGQLANTIAKFGYGAAIFVAAANLFNSILIVHNFNPELIAAYFAEPTLVFRDFMHAITLGITVIVMAVPEGLPMMITVVLSSNMRKMLKDNVLVRKLVGIETSGSINILFTDKTGTLTRGAHSVTSFVTAAGRLLDAEQLRGFKPLYNRVALNCFYNNSAKLTMKKLRAVALGGNSTDRALMEYVMLDAPQLPLCEAGFRKPFNSKDKMSIAAISGDCRAVFIKGAPENLLPNCRHAYNETGAKTAFSSGAAVKKTLASLAKDGVRLLALCEAATPEAAESGRDLTLVGFIGIRDEIRTEARAAISEVLGAGVQVVMVTGDNRDTAVNVATRLGMITSDNDEAVLTSQSLAALSDTELKNRLPKLRVIARALPSDKGRLVRIAQENGLVVGMTGDGVNDAPALKKADVGFSMGSGTEIAKEASEVVILDNNIASIVKAILYGRTIFKSIRKFLIFQLSINLGAVGVSIIGPFLGVPTPVTVIQMLWINMIMDTLAGLAYAGEAPLREYMKEKPKRRSEPIINRYMFSQIVSCGLYTTLLSLIFFRLPIFADIFRNDYAYLLTAFFGLFIFAGVFNSLNARTYRLNLLAYIGRNRAFIGIMLAVSALQLLLIYFGGAVFRTTGLSFSELVVVLGLASTVIVFDLCRKVALRATRRKGFI